MLIIWKLLEKLLVSVLVSLVIAIVSFSMITGHFPPRKSDMAQAFRLGKQMFFQTQELNQANKNMQAGSGGISLEQMAILQEMGLKRTQTTIELMSILKRFPQGVPNQALANELQKISNHLDEAGRGIETVQQSLMNPQEISN